MKFIQIALLLSGAALSSAQITSCSAAVAAVPTCGTPCLNSAASGVGCATADFACQCSSSASAAIVTAALGCVVSACGFATALEVSSSAAAICTACV